MTTEELKQHHARIYRILDHEIRIRQQNGDKYTITLAQLEEATGALDAIKSELKIVLERREQQFTQLRLIDTPVEYSA